MYIKKPMEIETKSMDIIEKKLKDVSFSEKEKTIVKRMIHTTGDPGYRKIVSFKNNFIEAAERALQEGITVFTDTKMVLSGINKPALSKTKNTLLCLIDDDEVLNLSAKNGTTRSSAAVDLAVQGGAAAFVIGNAPTALFRLLELYAEGKISPRFVVGVPVGFVGAAESKKALGLTAVPHICTRGTKGGSTVAASIINALLYMQTGR